MLKSRDLGTEHGAICRSLDSYNRLNAEIQSCPKTEDVLDWSRKQLKAVSADDKGEPRRRLRRELESATEIRI